MKVMRKLVSAAIFAFVLSCLLTCAVFADDGWEYTCADKLTVTAAPADGVVYAAFYGEDGRISERFIVGLSEPRDVPAGVKTVKLFLLDGDYMPLSAAKVIERKSLKPIDEGGNTWTPIL